MVDPLGPLMLIFLLLLFAGREASHSVISFLIVAAVEAATCTVVFGKCLEIAQFSRLHLYIFVEVRQALGN